MQLGNAWTFLFALPKPDEDEAMPDPHEDMCSGKASGKGRPLRVPELGEEDGPKWMYGGGFDGWKVQVGQLPSNISEAASGHYCDGQKHISVLSHNPRSRIASALVTFVDLARAMKPLSSWQWTTSTMMDKCIGPLSNASEAPSDGQFLSSGPWQ